MLISIWSNPLVSMVFTKIIQHLIWPFQTCIYHCHLHTLQAVNCYRNSRLAVDEDDLKWMTNLRKLPHIRKKFNGNSRSNTHSCRTVRCVFRDVKWCFSASWGLKGLINPWSPHDALKHHFLGQEVLKRKFPWNWLTNTCQFSSIPHPLQVIFIHYKSGIATAIRGL